MVDTLTEQFQADLRTATGTTQTYEGDLHALADAFGIPRNGWGERILALAQRFDSTISTPAAAQNFFFQNDLSATYGLTKSFAFLWAEALPSEITFTRTNAVSTRINSNGFVELVGADLPRFDYSFSTPGQPRGLLLEEARTNLLVRSNNFAHAAWNKINDGGGSAPVVTAAANISPDGTANASRLQCAITNTGGDDYSMITQTPAGSGSVFTSSVWMRSNTGINQTILLRAGNTLTAVTVTPAWQRFSVISPAAPASYPIDIGLRRSVTGDSALTADILIYEAQLEVGAFATSNIPTTTASVTRSADIANMTDTNFSNWFNQTEGTFLIGFDTLAPTATRAVLSAYQDVNNYLEMWVDSSARGRTFVAVGGATQATLASTATVTANTAARLASGYKADDFGQSLNGTTANTDLSGTLPTPTVLNFGQLNATTSLNGHIRGMVYFSKKLSSALLQSLSA